jgi:hypothetical protein
MIRSVPELIAVKCERLKTCGTESTPWPPSPSPAKPDTLVRQPRLPTAECAREPKKRLLFVTLAGIQMGAQSGSSKIRQQQQDDGSESATSICRYLAPCSNSHQGLIFQRLLKISSI